MSREARRVPANWEHPKQSVPDWRIGRMIESFKPLFSGDSYQSSVDEWDEACAKWKRGEYPDYASTESRKMAYEQWAGQRPHRDDYMPVWTPEEATHFMMYETTSEGTPISPAFATPEELALWLFENGASAFGDCTATYEGWLRVARGGFAPSAVISDGVLQSGVDALSDEGVTS